MGNRFMNALFDGGGELEQTPFWVLMSLCWFVNDQTATDGVGTCWPSTKAIAAKAHVSELTARRALKTLIERGIVTTKQPPGGVRVFTIRIDQLKNLSGAKHVNPPKDLYPPKEVEGPKDVSFTPLNILRGTPERSLPTPPKDLYPEPRIEPGIEQRNEQVVDAFENAPPPTDSDLEAMASSGSLFSEADVPAEEPPKKKPRPPTVPFPDSLPDEWRERALKLRPNIDPEEVFTALRSRYGETTVRKAMSTWKREYFNWHGRQWPKKTFNRNQTQGRAYVPGDRKFSYATLDTSQFDYEG